MPGGTDILIDMECSLRDKEVQVAHLMACVYDEQNRTQDKQSQVLRLDAERLELGRKLAEMEGLKRLHIGELEARNRAMISELDTARMELDNKIREKRELMQAHAAYVEEMERQHALRVDELDTLVSQYRQTIWQYESKVEGLEKELDHFKQSAAPRPKVDLSALAASSEGESIDDVRAKNEQLFANLNSVMADLELAEGQRDSSRREVEALKRDLGAANKSLAASADENSQYANQVGSLQKERATASAMSAAPVARAGAPATKGSYEVPAAAMAAGDSNAAEAMIRQQASEGAQYDDLRKKLLHTCIELLDEFDDKKINAAKDLISGVERAY